MDLHRSKLGSYSYTQESLPNENSSTSSTSRLRCISTRPRGRGRASASSGSSVSLNNYSSQNGRFATSKQAASGRHPHLNSYSRHSLNMRAVSPARFNIMDNHAVDKTSGMNLKAITTGQSRAMPSMTFQSGLVVPVAKTKMTKNAHLSGGVARPENKAITDLSAMSITPKAKSYTIKPIIPAAKKELLAVAKAMHREEFSPRVKKLFDPEREAALQAIETGIYIGWRCPDFKWDCIRVGKKSKCFCGHLLEEHKEYSGNMYQVKCLLSGCVCKSFSFIPSRPEDIGEWWLPKRPGFDVSSWQAKCRCKHTHKEHASNNPRRCKIKCCSCFEFESNFLCSACDQHWENHETVFETADQRRKAGIPYGEEYLPFHELPALRNIVLTGQDDNNELYDTLTSGPYAIPRSKPTDLARRLQGEKM